MKCPVCKNESTRVLDSRVASDGVTVRRRRECSKKRCSFRFSTIEEIELLDFTIVKRNDRKESYNKEKLKSGIKKALEKRPHTDEEVAQLIRDIEMDLQKTKKSEVDSSVLGDIVMDNLRRFDKVAYIRYASVYRSFEDVKTFEKELRDLKKK
jgi:transcriptional repressor NrdR